MLSGAPPAAQLSIVPTTVGAPGAGRRTPAGAPSAHEHRRCDGSACGARHVDGELPGHYSPKIRRRNLISAVQDSLSAFASYARPGTFALSASGFVNECLAPE